MYSIQSLQFEALLELFVRNCRTVLGAERFADLSPHTGRLALEHDLACLAETFALDDEKAGWTLSEIADPTEIISLLKIGNARLEPQNLLDIADLLSQATNAAASIRSAQEFAPTLFSLVENLPSSLRDLSESIRRKILPNGEIDDSASPELRRLRREINSMRAALTKQLEAVFRKKGNAIQDEIVTLRNERYVVPVKADFSGGFGGVAHGASSSGATVFIEPMEVVEANNELQRHKALESAEIAKILYGLTDEARQNLDGIETAATVVAELDFIKAKAVFAKSFDAVIPEISNGKELEFIDARHPLLEESLRLEVSGSKFQVSSSFNKKSPLSKGSLKSTNLELETRNSKPGSIVPVSFSLSEKNAVMIISGANAGGKTVVLKTAGLLSLMAVCGLPVPAESAKVPFYASILADIGDNQSLTANLSTFTSHISNIASMFENLSTPSLILLDEVGTGTDPDEGSALGVAIVDHFRNAGSHIIASTHYKGLKIYATNDPDVINASVEFDEKTLHPTYRLLSGLAGASSGLEIARRFGISDEVIQKAFENLDDSARETADYLRELQRETKTATDLRKALEEEREATAEKYSRLDIEFGKKEQKRGAKFKNEIETVIGEFEKQAKELLKSITDKKQIKKIEKEVASARAALNRKAQSVIENEKPTSSKTEKAFEKKKAVRVIKAPIVKDTQVMLRQFGTLGRVDKIEGNSAYVTVGSVRMKQKLKDLQPIEVSAPVKSVSSVKTKKQSGSTLDTNLEDRGTAHELNLIGKTTLDAEDEVDRFLDDSYAAKIMRIRIIHGHGTGALKNAVQNILKGHPHVESFGFAPQNEGGNGATVVELKS